MEKEPQFIKQFSKEESAEERQQAAQEIKAKRAEHFTEKQTQAKIQAELEESTSEREQILSEQLESIHSLENEITELSTSSFGKIINYFKLKKSRAEVIVGQRTYEELKKIQDTEIVEQQMVSKKLNPEEIPPALQEAKTMLDNFYEGQKEKWAKSEYTKEDITKNFSEEHLASLSLEDYALLLKRFPKEMVTHVTRQGIRDHIGHMFHTGGEGAYADNFIKMVDDGRLRSPLGVYLIENEKKQAISRFLHLDNFETKEEALESLTVLTDKEQGSSGSYVDRMAVHFATEEVADAFYGSEKENEIFIAYPSAHIASQYYFYGQLNKRGGDYWNDQWVWANEEKGMDLNAGLIFIPEKTMVGRNTGSRYELDKNGDPVKNSEYRDAMKRVVDSPNFHDFASEVMKITGKLSQDWDNPDLHPKNREILAKLDPFRQRLEQEFSIIDQRLQMAILQYDHLYNLNYRKEIQEKAPDLIDAEIENAMKDEGILYIEAKDVITSKEFWESHFEKNSAKKPSKIIYYKGSSPTIALNKWRDSQGINKKSEEKDIGFSEQHTKRNAPQATAGLDRFKILAKKVIEDHFSDEKQ